MAVARGILVMCLLGCTSGGGVRPRVEHEQVVFSGEVAVTGIDVDRQRDVVATAIPVAADLVFGALPASMASLKLQVVALDKGRSDVSARLAGARGFLYGARLSSLFNCGESAMGRTADRYALSIVVSSSVTSAAGGSSTLSSMASATARPDDSGMSVSCTSTGALEKRLRDSLLVRVGVALPATGRR